MPRKIHLSNLLERSELMAVPANGFFSLKGRVALVTGGAQGIGAAIAARLAAAGAKVAIADLQTDATRAAAAKLGALATVGDMTSEADLQRVQKEIEAEYGPVELLVNNAGITGKAGKIWELQRQDLDCVLTVNVTGPWLCCRQFLPGMLERKFGRIVNVASIAGKEGNPTLGPYSASKAALIALTKSMAKEVAGLGDITINAISPAVIATPILDGLPQSTVDYMVSKIPMGRVGKPEEVAALVHYLLSDEASFTTGQCYDISGGRATY